MSRSGGRLMRRRSRQTGTGRPGGDSASTLGGAVRQKTGERSGAGDELCKTARKQLE